uniref:YdbL family protein n=1 Tax=Candidatus Nitrotoga sp. M5 TaxID=2890409 RepID=UPI001EF27F88|nr:YdbL family protein [Candidatus Nitrotoga sp. M5]
MLFILCVSSAASAQVNIEINTPGVVALKQSMQTRHAQLAEHYASGAVGLTSDGLVALRDANAVPLASRQKVNGLIAAENQDRKALYAEIARANAHPEWEGDIRNTFAQRWIQHAQAGWWIHRGGTWSQK